MRLVGRGNEHIRATHTKTLELSPDETISARATCVIAVGVRPAPSTPGSGVLPLAGPVRITISAGDQTFALQARANPSWDPSGPAVIRRSSLRLPGTLATDASASSAQLPRALVDAMRSPSSTVEVTLESIAGRPCLVLFAADPNGTHDPRLAAELAVADLVVAEDAGARRLAAGLVGDIVAGLVGGLVGDLRTVHRAPNTIDRRVLVLATDDLPGGTVPPLAMLATGTVGLETAGLKTVGLETAGLETVGLSARLAVAAASSSRAPLVLVPDGVDARAALRATPAGHRVVLAVEHGRLPALLALADEWRGSAGAVLAQMHAPPIRLVEGVLPDLPSKDTVYCCLEPTTGPVALDPAVRLAMAGLLVDGVATKVAARALAELTGWSRRQAYDVLVTWRGTGTGNNLGL